MRERPGLAKRRDTSMGETDTTFDVTTSTGTAGAGADCVIRIRGDVDLRSLPQLRRALRYALAARPVLLIVDMAEVGFVDAHGLVVLATARRRGLDVGVRLLLQAPGTNVADLLAETGIGKMLPVLADPDADTTVDLAAETTAGKVVPIIADVRLSDRTGRPRRRFP
jgi:anti-sigma B factor antagonist